MFHPWSFSPLVLRPALWLDASDASTIYDATSGGSLVAPDGAIARWEDKSGNGRHATQGTGVSQPLRKTAIQNGRDVIRFDGSNDYLSGSLPAIGTGNYTCFIVTIHNSTANFDTSYLLGGDAADSALLVTKGNTDVLLVGRISGDFLATSNNITGVKSITVKRDGSLVYGWVNNSSTTPASANPGAQDIAANYKIGAIPLFAQHMNGDVVEFLVFTSALSDSDRAAVEAYLNSKWAIY